MLSSLGNDDTKSHSEPAKASCVVFQRRQFDCMQAELDECHSMLGFLSLLQRPSCRLSPLRSHWTAVGHVLGRQLVAEGPTRKWAAYSLVLLAVGLRPSEAIANAADLPGKEKEYLAFCI